MRLRPLAAIAAIAALVVALAATVGWLVHGQPTTSPANRPSATAQPANPSTSSPATSYNPDAHDAQDENSSGAAPETQESLWGPVVNDFAREFTNTRGGQKKWRQRLIGPNPARPHVTAEVAEQLTTVDVRNVPEGTYDSHELVQSGPYEIGVKVTYNTGWAMILYLITDGTNWQIYAYDKWEP